MFGGNHRSRYDTESSRDHTLIDLQLPPHNRTVFCSTDTNQIELIAKHVATDLTIFEYLRAIQPQLLHVVQVIDTVPTNTGNGLFPRNYTPYRISSAFAMTTLKFVVGLAQLARDLIAGLAHLHDHGIAHLDVKPGNLLCADDFRVASEDQVVGGVYGTQGWMAPEIREGAVLSPIRADRRFCGKRLLWFLEKGG